MYISFINCSNSLLSITQIRDIYYLVYKIHPTKNYISVKNRQLANIWKANHISIAINPNFVPIPKASTQVLPNRFASNWSEVLSSNTKEPKQALPTISSQAKRNLQISNQDEKLKNQNKVGLSPRNQRKNESFYNNQQTKRWENFVIHV